MSDSIVTLDEDSSESPDTALANNWQFDNLLEAVDSPLLLWRFSPLRWPGAVNQSSIELFLRDSEMLVRRHGWRRLYKMIDRVLLPFIERGSRVAPATQLEIRCLKFALECIAGTPPNSISVLKSLRAQITRLETRSIAGIRALGVLRKFIYAAAEHTQIHIENNPAALQVLFENIPPTVERRAWLAERYWSQGQRDDRALQSYVLNLADDVNRFGEIPNLLKSHQKYALERMRVDPLQKEEDQSTKIWLNRLGTQSLVWAEPWLWLGLSLSNHSETELRRVSRMFSRAAQVATNQTTKGEAHAALGNALSELGEFEEAGIQFELASENGITADRVAASLGFSLVRAKRWADAVRQFEAYADTDGEQSHDLLVAWGRALTMLNEDDGALQKFDAAHKKEPASHAAISGIAACYLRAGKQDQAINWLDKSSEALAKATVASIRNPNIGNARTLIERFGETGSNVELEERTLCFTALSPILTATFGQERWELGTQLELCETLLKYVDEDLPWTIQTKFVAALVQGDLQKAESLAQSQTLPSNPTITNAQRALTILLGGDEAQTSLLDGEVLNGLHQETIEAIPLLASLRTVLSAAAALPNDNWGGALNESDGLDNSYASKDSADATELTSLDLSDAPVWIRWLHVRTLFLVDQRHFLEHLSPDLLNTHIVAWEVNKIAATYLPIGATEHELVQKTLASDPLDVAQESHHWRGLARRYLDEELSYTNELDQIRALTPSEQLEKLQAVRLALSKKDVLQRGWFSPQVEYRYLVATLRLGGSVDNLADLGWMRSKGFAQQAIGAIAMGQVDRAQSYLELVTEASSASVYAQALVASRRQAWDEALAQLDELRGYGVEDDYTRAAQELSASLLERSGQTYAAKDAYLDLQTSSRNSLLARDRLDRLLFQQAYQEGNQAAIAELSERDIEDDRINLLVNILWGDYDRSSTTTVKTEADEVIANLTARRRLKNGDVDGALASFGEHAASSAAVIIKVVTELRNLTDKDATDTDLILSVRNALQRLDVGAGASPDQPNLTTDSWRARLRQCEKLLIDGVTEEGMQEAVAGFASSNWTSVQHALANLLAGSESPEELYETLETDLEALPIDAAEIWLAAAPAWLQSGQLEKFTEDAMPSGIQDFEDPRVRLLVAMANGMHATAAVSKGNSREAQRHISRAMSTLEPLVDVQDSSNQDNNGVT